MAASDINPRFESPSPEGSASLSAHALSARLDEEIGRAERHGTKLSCLVVLIDNLEELTREHGGELSEQTLEYVGGALQRELRRFDRVGAAGAGELVIVLPGADGPHGEMVARRVLERVRTIKVELDGSRRALRVSVGLAAWSVGNSAEELLARAREATRTQNGNGNGGHGPDTPAARAPQTR